MFNIYFGKCQLCDLYSFAKQVLESRGDKGHNVEYVLKLAEWIRDKLPQVQDEHLFELEQSVRRKIEERGLCLSSLMGDTCEDIVAVPKTEAVEPLENVAASNGESECESGFSAQVRPICLRCVKC